jgi:hypothetical protein
MIRSTPAKETPAVMSKVFLSHSSQDDGVVRALQQALADLGVAVWSDARELRGGDSLWPSVRQALEAADAFVVLVSPDALQSRWVGKELQQALALQQVRGPAAYPIIALSLDGTRLGALKQLFGEEPAYIPIGSATGGIESALHAILVALGRRLLTDCAPTPQPPAEPVEELVLELTDLRFHHQDDGVRRASAQRRTATGRTRYRFAVPDHPHCVAPSILRWLPHLDRPARTSGIGSKSG